MRKGRVKHDVNNTKDAWESHKETDFISFLKYVCIYLIGITTHAGDNALPRSYRLSKQHTMPSMG